MRLLVLFFICCVLFQCADRPNLSNIPSLEYLGASKKIMRQGKLNQDTVFLKFKFTDGDGDIAYTDANNRKPDLIIIDKRTGVQFDNFILPSIPQQGTNNGIVGTMNVTLYTLCCKVQPCDPYENQPDEQLLLEAYIFDRAGNKSNLVNVEDLTLRCY